MRGFLMRKKSIKVNDYPNEYVKIIHRTMDQRFAMFMQRSIYEMGGWRPLLKLPEGCVVTQEIDSDYQ